ncbi:MAG: hypothetical protein GY835_22750 [bacterium]|nr:hypothetical protein [bacterium]
MLLRARSILAQYGLPDRDEATLRAIASLCRRRIAAVGVRQYVYEILGGRANRPAREFKLWYGDEYLAPKNNDKLVDFLVMHGRLPDKIEDRNGSGNRQTFYIAV